MIHQVSQVHTAAFIKAFGIDPKKVLTIFREHGNIGPASVPIVLSKLQGDGPPEEGRPRRAAGHRLGPELLDGRSRLVTASQRLPGPVRRRLSFAAASVRDESVPNIPFTPKRFEVRPGLSMSYLDEGPRDGEVVVMLHGNPSWSYYWRNLVLGLRGKLSLHRARPHRHGPVRQARTSDALRLHAAVAHRRPRPRCCDTSASTGPVTLAVHDWGGMIGFGWALRTAAQVQAAGGHSTPRHSRCRPAKKMPWQLSARPRLAARRLADPRLQRVRRRRVAARRR